jgi:hypothetical protein
MLAGRLGDGTLAELRDRPNDAPGANQPIGRHKFAIAITIEKQ